MVNDDEAGAGERPDGRRRTDISAALPDGAAVLWHNIVLVTVDSCRFDTAIRAATPVLDAIGDLRRGETYGSFTLPAHAAIFGGFLPNVREEPLRDFYSKECRQLWRLGRARRPARPRHLLLLPGADIVAGLREHGYRTIGAGGVRWFSSGHFPALFDEFHYWGPRNDATDKFAPREAADFALSHAEHLIRRAREAGRFFLFVNAAETHAPYTTGEEAAEAEVYPVLRRWSSCWNGAARLPRTEQARRDMEMLHDRQIAALEVVDSRLGRLLDGLPGPLLVIVCADHGEAFGEDSLWGHDFPAPSVMEVPLWIGLIAT